MTRSPDDKSDSGSDRTAAALVLVVAVAGLLGFAWLWLVALGIHPYTAALPLGVLACGATAAACVAYLRSDR